MKEKVETEDVTKTNITITRENVVLVAYPADVSTSGTFLDPPEGESVLVPDEGDPEGEEDPEHWETGGVCTLQAEGRAMAWVWLTSMPRDDPPPPAITWQRHSGCVLTTLESCEQQDEDGLDEFPVM